LNFFFAIFNQHSVLKAKKRYYPDKYSELQLQTSWKVLGKTKKFCVRKFMLEPKISF